MFIVIEKIITQLLNPGFEEIITTQSNIRDGVALLNSVKYLALSHLLFYRHPMSRR